MSGKGMEIWLFQLIRIAARALPNMYVFAFGSGFALNCWITGARSRCLQREVIRRKESCDKIFLSLDESASLRLGYATGFNILL
jgi:hypothetical protein